MSPPEEGRRVDPLRIFAENEAPVREGGDYVLYWMIASRRPHDSHALQRAANRALELDRPLLILEPLRVAYPHASRRLHRFVLEGMADNSAAFAEGPATWRGYVEPEAGAGSGLLEALAERACVVVTDHWPSFFVPRMVAAAAARLAVRLESVDSVGLLPLDQPDRDFTVAHSFRRHLHKELPPFLDTPPLADPLAGVELPRLEGLPDDIDARWPAPDPALLEGDEAALAELPIDAEVPPVAGTPGGWREAERRLERFVDGPLASYHERSSEATEPGSSGLSAHLHFGHVGAWRVFRRVAEQEGWSPDEVGEPSGKREGWWGMSEGAEAFLDELVTWRELGHVQARRALQAGEAPDGLDRLPDWARETLAAHADDERPHLYERADFEAARTHDALWNACQRQLRREGTIHGYLRMYWGKKLLHWSPDPETARELLFALNDRWALDGRDPNSVSNLLWVLGLNDRAWGPEREVFGKVRYMTRSGAERKFDLDRYLERYGAG